MQLIETANQKQAPFPPVLALSIGVIAISFSAIFIKWSHAPASIMGMYRLLFTALMMTPFLYQYRNEIRTLKRKEIGLLMLSGIFLGFHFLFWIGSLIYTTVASSMILISLQPIFVMAGAFVFFRERINLFAAFSICAAIVGTCIVGWGDFGVSGTAVYGDILSLLGTFAVSLHMLVGQTLRSKLSSFVYSYFVFWVAVGVFVLYNLMTATSMTAYPPREWGIFLLLAIVPTVFGHLLFNWLIRYVGATTVSMSILGEPVGAIILAFLLLGEAITLPQAIGGIITLAGVLLFFRTNKP